MRPFLSLRMRWFSAIPDDRLDGLNQKLKNEGGGWGQEMKRVTVSLVLLFGFVLAVVLFQNFGSVNIEPAVSEAKGQLSVRLTDEEISSLRKLALDKSSDVYRFKQSQVSLAKKHFADTPKPIAAFTSGLSKAIPEDRELIERESASSQDFKIVTSLYWSWVFSENGVCLNLPERKVSQRECLDKMKAYFTAWANTYKYKTVQTGLRGSGNPITETRFFPFILAYARTRHVLGLSGQQERVIQKWLSDEYAGLSSYRFSANATNSNFRSHQLLILGIISVALDDVSKWNSVMSTLKTHIDNNIDGSGVSIDFKMRDAVHYHKYDLEPLLKLACVAQRNGEKAFYHERYAGVPKLKRAVEFMIPHINGTLKHAEFARSSNLPNDWTRHPRANPRSPEHSKNPLIFDSLATNDSDYGNLRDSVVKLVNLASCMDSEIETDPRYSRYDSSSKSTFRFNQSKVDDNLVAAFNPINIDRCDREKADRSVVGNGFLCSNTSEGFEWLKVEAGASPTCSTGIRSGNVCCPASCGTCGGTGCSKRPGGASCCTGEVLKLNRMCAAKAPPCVLGRVVGESSSLKPTATPSPSPSPAPKMLSQAPVCAKGGIFSSGVCCPASCGTCGGVGCGNRPGGASCCTGAIKKMNRSCLVDAPPCIK